MSEDRTFTVAEAEAELDELRERLPRLRDARRTLIASSHRIEEAVALDGGGVAGTDWFAAQQVLKAEVTYLADRGILLKDPETGLVIDPPSPAAGPEARLLEEEDGRVLRAALDEMGDPCREVLELRYFADLGYDDISNLLGINAKTVSSRLSKCLDRLEEIGAY